MQPDRTTRRAEQIRNETGVAWEIACQQAERERDQGEERERVPIIAQRFDCPSCGAGYAEPCKLGGQFPQEFSHVARHKIAQAAAWAELQREIALGLSPISSVHFAR